MKLHYSMLVVAAVIALNVWFADRVLTVVEHTSIEPVVLIGAWFSFTTVELWCLKDIKKTKIKNKKEGESNDS